MNRILSIFMVFAGLFVLNGCNSTGSDGTYQYNSNKPYAWVHDDCGDSVRVNWTYDPNHPGDATELLFDSVSVAGLRIRDYATHSDTTRMLIKVGVVLHISGGSGQWELDSRDDSYLGEETGKDYDEHYYSFGCFTYGTPKITHDLVAATADDGDETQFTVEATDGTSDNEGNVNDHNNYYWYKNGVLLEDTTYVVSYNAPFLRIGVTLADNNAKFKVVVDNGYGKVTSKEVTLKVNPARPHIYSLHPYILQYDPVQAVYDTVEDYYLYAGDSVNMQVFTAGTVTSYAWTYKGVAVGTSGPTLSLGRLWKSDSGSTVRCIVGNSIGKDTVEYEVDIESAPWRSTSFSAGPPNAISYGSLLDLDTSSDANIPSFPGSTITSRQQNLDLVMGLVGSSYKLVAPKLAKKMGISSTSALDTSLLAATKMVLFKGDIPTQEVAATLYSSGTKMDSVTVGTNGYFQGNSENHILLKTTAGRLFIIESPALFNSTFPKFGFYGWRGSVSQ